MRPGFEATEGSQNDGVAVGGVGHGEVEYVFIGFDPFAVRIFTLFRLKECVLVVIYGFFHEDGAETAPFGDGHFVNEMPLGKVAGRHIGTSGVDDFEQSAFAFDTDGDEPEVSFAGWFGFGLHDALSC